MNCCSKYFLILGFGRLVTTEPEFCRVADTRPNRVAEPSIGSALTKMSFLQKLLSRLIRSSILRGLRVDRVSSFLPPLPVRVGAIPIMVFMCKLIQDCIRHLLIACYRSCIDS